MRLVHWFVTVPVAVVARASSRSRTGERVTVTFWPLPVRLEAPLYLVVLLAALVVGFLVGELVAWIKRRTRRRAARARARRIEALERELAASRNAAIAAAAAPR